MTTNQNIKKEVLKILSISPQALSKRTQRVKKDYGPMTTEEAVYVIAHNLGIDLSRYLPIAILDRVRSLLPKEIKSLQSDMRSAKKIKQEKISYPLVTRTQINVANNLGMQIYPKLYVLENSIRNLIVNHLEAIEVDWWENYVPLKIRNNVSRTMIKEKHYAYREKRGINPISYANFSDLCVIILENKPIFKDVILDFEWFKVKMQEIYMVRNNIAHCVAISSDDKARLNLFFGDWSRLLLTAGIK